MYIFMATFIGLIMNSKCQQTLIKNYKKNLVPCRVKPILAASLFNGDPKWVVVRGSSLIIN